MNSKLVNHSVFEEILAGLRNVETSSASFRSLSYRAGLILAVEATRTLETKSRTINTPLKECTTKVLKRDVAIIPILRAGLSLVDPFHQIIPGAIVGHIGIRRDESTAKPVEYSLSLPKLEGSDVFIVDPMLATGGSACLAIKHIIERNPHSISLVSVIGAPEGVSRVQHEYPKVLITVGVIDEKLNANSFIVPGLGDFGDRLYGTGKLSEGRVEK